jgi:opacity protein-like surface antigen
MKLQYMIIALGAASASAFAGTPSVAPAPAPAPICGGWFIGGSFGQFSPDGSSSYDGSDLTLGDISGIDLAEGAEWLGVPTNASPGDATLGDFFPQEFGPGWEDDNLGEALAANEILADLRTEVSDVDLNMYSLHFGRSLACPEGFDLSAYLEVAWLTGDMDVEGIATNLTTGAALGNELVLFRETLDIDIVPVTINFKAEHNIYGPIGGYLSGGVGYAWTNVSGFGSDETDGGFYAQLAAGLVWNVTESVDLYGGGRWVYLDSLDFGDTELALDNQLGWEVGARYKF